MLNKAEQRQIDVALNTMHSVTYNDQIYVPLGFVKGLLRTFSDTATNTVADEEKELAKEELAKELGKGKGPFTSS